MQCDAFDGMSTAHGTCQLSLCLSWTAAVARSEFSGSITRIRAESGGVVNCPKNGNRFPCRAVRGIAKRRQDKSQGRFQVDPRKSWSGVFGSEKAGCTFRRSETRLWAGFALFRHPGVFVGACGLSGARASGPGRRDFSGSASLFRGKMREFPDFGGHLDWPAFLVPRLS